MFGVSTLSDSKLPGALRCLEVGLALAWFNPLGLMSVNRAVFGVHLGHLWHESEKIRQWLDALLASVAEGWVRPYVDRTFSFAQAGEAHAYIEAREHRQGRTHSVDGVHRALPPHPRKRTREPVATMSRFLYVVAAKQQFAATLA